MIAPEMTRRPDIERLFGAVRDAGRPTPAQKIDSAVEEHDGDHEQQHALGRLAGQEAAEDRACHGGRRHPAEQVPVDAPRADVDSRGRGGRHARHRDVRAAARRRRRSDRDHHGQPQIAEHEPHEAADERDGKAPEADESELHGWQRG